MVGFGSRSPMTANRGGTDPLIPLDQSAAGPSAGTSLWGCRVMSFSSPTVGRSLSFNLVCSVQRDLVLLKDLAGLVMLSREFAALGLNLKTLSPSTHVIRRTQKFRHILPEGASP